MKQKTIDRSARVLLCQKRWLICLICIGLLLGGAVFFLHCFAPVSVLPPVYDEYPAEVIEAALAKPYTASIQQQTVVASALSLVDKVDYFWSGKSEAVGWDEAWGTPRLVTAEGSTTTGTMQPYGLDCSGYIAWCFLQTGLSPEQVETSIGLGTKKQYFTSSAIAWEELQIGDIAFQYTPLDGVGNHVGICVGFLDDGEPLFAHCSFTYGNVVVTGRGNVFNHPRRPDVYDMVFVD